MLTQAGAAAAEPPGRLAHRGRRPDERADGSAAAARTCREIYRTTKTYDHNEGLSCCFRQWRASHSHCSLLHGYALSFRLVFAACELDACNWCLDFGGLKPIRAWLHHMFDHTLLVAEDDPELPFLQELAGRGLAEIRTLPAVGCEAIARYVHSHVADLILDQAQGRVWLESVEVREHGANAASYACEQSDMAGASAARAAALHPQRW